MRRKKINITPGTAILTAMARTGYDWTQAIQEIIDNSLDALLERFRQGQDICEEQLLPFVHIYVEADEDGKNIKRLGVADSGLGMTEEKIQEILKLGGSTRRDEEGFTGAFGMGLKTAAQTLGSQLMIMSTTSTIDELTVVLWDIEKNIKAGEFVATIEDPAKFRSHFLERVGNCPGTLIVVQNLREGLPLEKSFYKTVRKKCKHIYRHLLRTEWYFDKDDSRPRFEFYVGCSRTPKYQLKLKDVSDPLMVESETCTPLIMAPGNTFVDMEYNGSKFRMRAVHHEFPIGNSRNARQQGLGAYMHAGGTHRQGAYYLRNGREIEASCPWDSNPAASNLFIEIDFVDDGHSLPPIRTDFGKTAVVLDDNFKKFLLDEIIMPHVRELSRKTQAKVKANKKASLDEIMEDLSGVVSEMPAEKFGRQKNQTSPPLQPRLNPLQRLKSDGKSLRSYNGRGRAGGNTGLNGVTYYLKSWVGSTLPFDVQTENGAENIIVSFNTEHSWVKNHIIDNNDDIALRHNIRLVVVSALAYMYLETEVRHRLIERMGDALDVTDDRMSGMRGILVSPHEESEEDVPPAATK